MRTQAMTDKPTKSRAEAASVRVANGFAPLIAEVRELIVSMEKAAFIGALNFITSAGAAAIEFKALKAALIIIAIVPILLFYPFVLKYFVTGKLQGSIKE